MAWIIIDSRDGYRGPVSMHDPSDEVAAMNLREPSGDRFSVEEVPDSELSDDDKVAEIVRNQDEQEAESALRAIGEPFHVLTWDDDEGRELRYIVPARFEVCQSCRGKGTRVNPAIDGHGISSEEFAEDPDFEEAYWRGDYDIRCDECNGQRVVPVPDLSKVPEILRERYEHHLAGGLAAEASIRAEEAAERRFCGGY